MTRSRERNRGGGPVWVATKEYNFDGIVGPTHNYSGLSHGNVASTSHRHQASNPRAAALQGLEKMKQVADLGIGQAVLPPLFRPRIDVLRRLGFSGSDTTIIDSAWKVDPVLVAGVYSASNMWTANAATVSPSSDCGDGRLHLTVANLSHGFHRSLEADSTFANLNFIFSDEARFAVHPALPGGSVMSDEGAANHTRLGSSHGSAGIELFVYGRSAFRADLPSPVRFPARQTLESAQAIARLHQLDSNRAVFIQQNPEAIDAGVFHNDVIAVGNQSVLLVHQTAFVDQQSALDQLKTIYRASCDDELQIVQLDSEQLTLEDAVKSYLFNSQLISRDDGGMTLVCPSECQNLLSANRAIQSVIDAENPIDHVLFLDLRQSMNNGGGPACLRLRVALNADEAAAIHPGILFNDERYELLKGWIERHYRDELKPDDLRDPKLMAEVSNAFTDLSRILQIPESVLMT